MDTRDERYWRKKNNARGSTMFGPFLSVRLPGPPIPPPASPFPDTGERVELLWRREMAAWRTIPEWDRLRRSTLWAEMISGIYDGLLGEKQDDPVAEYIRSVK